MKEGWQKISPLAVAALLVPLVAVSIDVVSFSDGRQQRQEEVVAKSAKLSLAASESWGSSVDVKIRNVTRNTACDVALNLIMCTELPSKHCGSHSEVFGGASVECLESEWRPTDDLDGRRAGVVHFSKGDIDRIYSAQWSDAPKAAYWAARFRPYAGASMFHYSITPAE